MDKFQMQLSLKKIPDNPDVFEFTISTPTLRAQFRVPRDTMNDLRILIERTLTGRGAAKS